MDESIFYQERPSIISITGLTKQFAGQVVVNNLDLDVKQGDVFGLLGPNGSGKTTIIRMLLGLLQPDAGHIEIFGLDHQEHAQEIQARIGGMIESPSAARYFSDLEHLQMFETVAGMRGNAKTRHHLDEMLELVGLTAQAKQASHVYSAGMTQRLAIGRALLHDPEIVLLDEPTKGLDPMGIREVRQMIKRLAEAGKTVILASHYLSEVQQVCNRVAVLQRGQIVKQGDVRALLRADQALLVRMNTIAEAQAAWNWLSSLHGEDWIKQVDIYGKTLKIVAPPSEAAVIVAILASQELFPVEVRPQQCNLEDIYFDLLLQDEIALSEVDDVVGL